MVRLEFFDSGFGTWTEVFVSDQVMTVGILVAELFQVLLQAPDLVTFCALLQ